MSRYTWRYRILGSMGILGLFAATVACQNSGRPSTIVVIRQQLGSIADEACDSMKLAPKSVVALSVVAAKNRSLAENAFIEALHHRGFDAYLRKDRDSSDALVTVNVLTDNVGFDQVRHDAIARTVQTEVEVRAEFQGQRPAQVLGIFRKMLRDTVSQREEDLYLSSGGTAVDEESTMFQRLLGPLIVLAGGIIVVYLFFTVRS